MHERGVAVDEEIKEKTEALGITQDEIGNDPGRLPGQVPELDAKEAAEAEAAAKPAEAEKELPVRNSYPIPEGTPDLLAKAFRTIPHATVLDYKRLYDSFANRDVPFLEFACELAYITNPVLLQRDLDRIVRAQQAFRINKAYIDNSLLALGN